MERNEFLITELRENTNLTDRNGIKDSVILRHLNDAQRTIQSLIHQAELEPSIFVGTEDLTPAEVTADLPDDIFMDNAVLYVMPFEVLRRLTKIQSSERGVRSGYFLENRTIGFTSGLLDTYDTFSVKYFKTMPTLDIRRGLVASKTTTSLTVTGHSTTVLIGSLSDFITVVDSYGEIIQRGIKVVSFNSGSGVITVDASTPIDTDVAAGHYVVMGKIASSHCTLPDACKPFLMDFCEKKMRSKNVSKETSNQTMFSEEQKEILIGLFQGNSTDPVYPPLIDTEWP